MIVLVGDDDPVLRVAADARRSVELSVHVALGTEISQEDPGGRKYLNPAVTAICDLGKIKLFLHQLETENHVIRWLDYF